MLTQEDQILLNELYCSLQLKNVNFIGYQTARDFDYHSLYRFLEFSINNAGDPFQDSTYELNTRELEVEVISFFADLLRAPSDDFYGYVGHGGTEGNMYGLYLARELYPDGIVYFSEDTHYSVSKSAHLLRMTVVKVRSQASGEIDYADLASRIYDNRDKPVIVCANLGTTMKEGKDDTARISAIIARLGINRKYIHCDAAFCGCYAQYLNPKPAFDFTEGSDSISISGHKFIGSPIPCGIVIARRSNVERIRRTIEYIGSNDTTISGSRNAFSPVILWAALKSLGEAGIRRRLRESLLVADYAADLMKAHRIPAWRNPNALTVVFPRVRDRIRSKWSLATEGEISHLVVTPGVTKETLDMLVDDVVAEEVLI